MTNSYCNQNHFNLKSDQFCAITSGRVWEIDRVKKKLKQFANRKTGVAADDYSCNIDYGSPLICAINQKAVLVGFLFAESRVAAQKSEPALRGNRNVYAPDSVIHVGSNQVECR